MSVGFYEGGPIQEAAPVFNLVGGENGKLELEMDNEGSIEIDPSQQDIVFEIATRKYTVDGLRGAQLREAILAELKERAE